MDNKIIIISAPSGSGKSTIISRLLKEMPNLELAVSACTRGCRPGEVQGRDYYFITPNEFFEKVDKDEFIEWEEVYEGCLYGTQKSEIERIVGAGKTPLFDIDVKGGSKMKSIFGPNAISIFIAPPSLEILEARLRNRGTESDESIIKRLGRAQSEMAFEKSFDISIVNDKLGQALEEVKKVIDGFIF